MAKKLKNNIKKKEQCLNYKIDISSVKLTENSLLDFVIGSSNVKHWNLLKDAFSCTSNEHFATKLLEIADEYLKGRKHESLSKEKHYSKKLKKCNNKKIVSIGTQKSKRKAKTSIETEKLNNIIVREPSPVQNLPEISSSLEIRKVENHTKEPTPDENNVPNFSILEASLTRTDVPLKSVHVESDPKNENDDKIKKKQLDKITNKKTTENKRKSEYDVRKAPELDIQATTNDQNGNLASTLEEKVDLKIGQCQDCSTRHVADHCPLYYPQHKVSDNITVTEWTTKYQTLHQNKVNIKSEKESDNSKDEPNFNYSYSKMSLPDLFYLDDTSTDHGLGVFIKNNVLPFTQFGPLVGKVVKEVDIPEDFSMRDLYEIGSDKENIYINTEDLESSNWIRFVRPAPVREKRNVTLITKENKLYLVTTRGLASEEELLYWQDSSVSTNKKKLEKFSCGGCNMVFAHPLYYRIHCSVFHDIRYSLTIRKYHCKVCGAAVLGKENIMKHAAELHNGQGAYQCQFCKKFFLRLNYLEMHRTYGCSANPHRSRPLCDFCGRKFCQPQKLKVHIKRMHSDFSVVLKEFQCKSCLKILGSRAALQRHMKEVHQKQMDGACSCSRCGKHFQNKSNLKIHMLTHSGIKPFRCSVNNCNAAFTTKQCLQFHYKKVHSFTEKTMPKIERSIDYTFQAYSGFNNSDDKKNHLNQNDNLGEDESDIDDESLDGKCIEDPPALQSPLQGTDENSSPETPSPIPMETYHNDATSNKIKILSKGSKKWIADDPPLQQQIKTSDIYHLDQNRLCKDELSSVSLQVQESVYDRKISNLSDFTRNEAANASLLVEAALGSVCSEPNIDIDVSTPTNCADSLVNNLYTLSQPDNLPDVTYSETVCISESRDINLISPSVNDHISVTDELNDELHHNQNIGMDYSNFHQEDFSPGNNSPPEHRSSFAKSYLNAMSPQSHTYTQQKNISPVSSPPRYDFGHAATNDHLSSDDSNGMAAQNLSLHSNKNDLQLDLSLYKTSYKMEPQNYLRKDFRLKFDSELDRKQLHVLGVENIAKSYVNSEHNPLEDDNLNQHDLPPNMQDGEPDDKETLNNHDRNKYPDDLSTDIRNKFELDLDLRLKSYENMENENLRTRNNLYESSNSDLDFRSKSYDLIDNIENRSKTYDSIETDFRPDRTFEPLILNSSELQGLDMSARSFHNYSNINRYHHLYPEVDRVDLRLNYSPPPPTFAHADIMRVVSLDLTPPGRHSVDLSLRTHPLHQIANTRILTDHTIQTNPHRLLDQSRLLSTDLASARHLSGETRLLSESGGRILSDHTTNRILSTSDQLTTNHLLSSEQNRLLSDESRIISEQPRLLEQSRLMSDGRILSASNPNGAVSPVPTFSGYSVSQSPYHPTPLAPRPHVTSPTTTPYHHYSAYY